ncbi:hypothetical protein ABQ22_24350, partial [Salmonella enterica subsp. enterica serovar Typhimurium]|nr:hypothetical protein [Salmonella enterica subsp. enterica serovar Typhimurium]
MILNSINKEQRLYVMKAGAGFTCYGFDVLNRKAAGVLQWLKSEGRAAEMVLGAKRIDVTALDIPARVGTKKHFTACDKVIDAGRAYALAAGRRCDVELTPQLVGLEGRRVEVVDDAGITRRFIVGRSSG